MDCSSNLLLNLHRWASRQDENFTTEALAHLTEYLLRSAPEIGVRLLRELSSGFLSLSPGEAKNVEIKTQPSTADNDHGRPDMEISTSEYLIYVEVKVDAPFADDQISSYLDGLRAANTENTRLVLLTKNRPPDFGDQSITHLFWYDIGEFLQQELAGDIQEPTRCFVQQFLDFLRCRHLAFASVKSPLSEGIQNHMKEYGSESVLQTHIKSLQRLDIYPELKPLQNLLCLMGQAVTDVLPEDVQSQFDSGQHSGGWIGYNLGKMKYFFHVYYFEQPDFDQEAIVFSTYNRPIEKAAIPEGDGRIVISDGHEVWQNELDLDEDFFSFPANVQLEKIEEFLTESYKMGEKICQ